MLRVALQVQGLVTKPLPAQAVENAIREGIIYWHAFPYNGQMELMDERAVREAVQMTHDLDAKYGYKPKMTLSQVQPPHQKEYLLETTAQAKGLVLSLPQAICKEWCL